MYEQIKNIIDKLHVLLLSSHENSDEGTAMLNELFKLAHLISEVYRGKDADSD